MKDTIDPHRWDLGRIYPDVAAFRADSDLARRLAAALRDAHRGSVVTAEADGVAAVLSGLQDVLRVVRRVGQYASLRVASDVHDQSALALQAEADRLQSDVDQALAFVAAELAQRPVAELRALAEHPKLAPLRNHLLREARFAPHTMSEDAERIVAMKDATGKHAWNQLYSEVTAGLLFPVEVDGETKKLTRSEANALRQSPDRALRERAVQSLADGHRAHEAVLTFVFNTIFEDHRAESAARGYPDALRFTVLQDDLDPEVVESLLQTTLAWGSIPRRWHALRKARLGLDDYGTEDLLAPAFGAPGTVSWDAAKAMTLDAFARFHPEAHEVARTLFDERRADVYPRPGKRSGAFCSPTLPPEPPFVMLNHADQLSDAMTCAHELGHALHFTLSLEQQPLVYWTGTSLAETASVFAELWLHDVLIERAQTDEERLRLLANQVEDAVGTAFRQVAYVDWERKAHALRAEGVVTAAEYAAIWERSMRWLHGDAVRVRERDGYGWLSVPHFIFARFYCYSYAFGKMLTLALYDLWKERGAAFVDAYLDMLRSGGSRSPRELVARLGVDLADPKFWERGCRVVDSWLDTLGAEKVA